MLISEILEKAASKCAASWGQGSDGTYHRVSRPCIGVAIEQCAGSGVKRVPRVRAALRTAGFFNAIDAMKWNDAPERTQSEVVSKLREAAAKARAEGR